MGGVSFTWFPGLHHSDLHQPSMGILRPNPSLNSDPACIVLRSLSSTRFLGFVQRLGAGGAG